MCDSKLIAEKISVRISAERAFGALYRGSRHAFWLDGNGCSRFSFLGDASGPLARVARVDVWSGQVRIDSAAGARTIESGFFDWLQRDLANHACDTPDLPFGFSLGWVGYLARLVRASMLEVLGEPHIRTARSFGLPERMIVFRYALRIAVLPTVTLLGTGVGSLLSSAVFAEVVFNRPGIGQLVLGAVNTRNYPVVMGAVLVTVGLFTLCTLIADLLVAAYDPRIRAGL